MEKCVKIPLGVSLIWLQRGDFIKDTTLEKRSIRREIYGLILPIIFENIFQISASLVTVAMIGRLSPADISAQGICMRITETLNSLFRGVAIGVTVYIARAYGEKNTGKCFHVFRQSILSAVPMAILFAAILFAAPRTFLSFLTAKENLLGIGSTYMRLTVCGLPFVTIMALVTSAFQGHSDTRTPMLIAVWVNACNIVFGYVLIFGVGGFEGLGINGAAIALSLSQCIGAVTGLILLFFGKRKVFARRQLSEERGFRLDWPYIREIYSTGIPAALENFFWQFSAIVMSRAILSYGEVCFSAYQIGIQAESIAEMPALGFGVAATALSAKAIGMGSDHLFKSYFKEQVRLCTVISIVTSLSLLLLPGVFMSIMTPNQDIQKVGTVYVFIMGFVQIPQNLSCILNGTLRASGFKNTPLIVSFIGIWLIRIPLALLVAYVLKWDTLFLWLCIALDQIVRITLSTFIFKKQNVLQSAALHSHPQPEAGA